MPVELGQGGPAPPGRMVIRTFSRVLAGMSASAASCVVTMPPSPVVTILTGWKLNTLASACALPMGWPL